MIKIRSARSKEYVPVTEKKYLVQTFKTTTFVLKIVDEIPISK